VDPRAPRPCGRHHRHFTIKREDSRAERRRPPAARPGSWPATRHQPRGWLVKEAVEAYVGLAEERRRETLAALEEVDTGRTVDHAEVEAWAASLGRAKKPRARSKRAD